ncbi:hypothetical protein KM043_014000 [Ampulex compressa]|nr:hypothetical protein KM043_014000 [Ampulex compressa]
MVRRTRNSWRQHAQILRFAIWGLKAPDPSGKKKGWILDGQLRENLGDGATITIPVIRAEERGAEHEHHMGSASCSSVFPMAMRWETEPGNKAPLEENGARVSRRTSTLIPGL